MPEHSRYQQKAIRNYYQNRATLALQRAEELISELYLSQGKQRQRHWRNLATHLTQLGVEARVVEHLIHEDDPQLAATLVKKLAAKA